MHGGVGIASDQAIEIPQLKRGRSRTFIAFRRSPGYGGLCVDSAG